MQDIVGIDAALLDSGMARLARIVVPNAPHHVTQRGNRREPIFFEDGDQDIYCDLPAGQVRKGGIGPGIIAGDARTSQCQDARAGSMRALTMATVASIALR